MADPLSVTASVLGVAGAALGCSKALHSFISTLKDAPEALTNLATELNSLNDILGQLEGVLQERKRNPDTLSPGQTFSLKKTERPLKQCENACKNFQVELDKVMSNMNKDGKKSFRDAFKKWFNESTLNDFKGKLDSWKVTLGLELQFITLSSLSANSEAIEKLDKQFDIAMAPLGKSLQEVDQRIADLTGSFNTLKFMDDGMREQVEANLTAQKLAAEEQKLVLEYCVELCDEVTRSVSDSTGHTFIANKAYDDALMHLGDVGKVPRGARKHIIQNSEVRDRARFSGGNMDAESFSAFMGLGVRQKQAQGSWVFDEEEGKDIEKPKSYYTEDYS